MVIYMASASGKSTTKSRTNSKTGGGKSTKKSSVKTTKSTRANSASSKKKPERDMVEVAVVNEVMLITILAAAIFVFLCVSGIIHGTASESIKNIMFGLFGLLAYVMPIIVFLGFAFSISNKGNTVATVKLVSTVILVFLLGILSYMIKGQETEISKEMLFKDLYITSAESHAGGGVIFGSLAHALYHFIGMGGTLFLVIVLGIICFVFITEKSFLSGVKKSGSYIVKSAKRESERMREYRNSLMEEYYDDEDDQVEQNHYSDKSRRKNNTVYDRNNDSIKNTHNSEKVLRMNKKARGVASGFSTTIVDPKNEINSARHDIHEIIMGDHNINTELNAINDYPMEEINIKPASKRKKEYTDNSNELANTVAEENYDTNVNCNETFDGAGSTQYNDAEEIISGISTDMTFMSNYADDDYFDDKYASNIEEYEDNDLVHMAEKSSESEAVDINYIDSMPEPVTENTIVKKEEPKKITSKDREEIAKEQTNIENIISKSEETEIKKYVFPPLTLLRKGENKKSDTTMQLKETAYRLQQTLQNFGVKVTITDISQGPSVTRYEMQPEQGVKVSKIVGLSDDIKLNLAATDIRIEAPIPGKAAVGIEVPNKENSAVAFRDLLESDAFRKFNSNLCIAVGKDIAGQVVVADIAKMPHVLIAGATGSGKSVCINTIIMSIIYKADPSDVKLIMIDPKVVELSVYNGIPHLMIPVVTDPKKASAALNWGVAEMTDRYNKFADLNVRDLKGYNKAVEAGKTSSDGEPLKKLPQIVIIVDELADLMMVASKEVEESICRLAQLARACGIHLVIATQRPSVDVITGLIKANMPSRIAFSVSSGVDSRTILDMNGAEKLLGKGDMLFYPQGYTKPARVQGAFISDSEVSDVVEFLKNQMLGNNYSNDVEQKIQNMQTGNGSAQTGNAGSSEGNGYDEYFVQAGKFVIEKEKASIGMLQRVFRIGFNRAARIVDQLEEAGVVGAEEGTKARKILMSMEQFENFIDENI